MGRRPLEKMPISQRAKQFAPFDALKGFKESNRNVEESFREFQIIELDKDQLDLLQEKLFEKQIGDKIEITYLSEKEYKKIEGIFKGVNEINKSIYVNEVEIKAINIIEII